MKERGVGWMESGSTAGPKGWDGKVLAYLGVFGEMTSSLVLVVVQTPCFPFLH